MKENITNEKIKEVFDKTQKPIDVNIILGNYTYSNNQVQSNEIEKKNDEIEKENEKVKDRNTEKINKINPFEKHEFPSINLENYPKEDSINSALPKSSNTDSYDQFPDINIQKANPYN